MLYNEAGLINEGTTTKSSGFMLSHKHHCDWIQVSFSLVYLIFIFAFFAVSAEAGMVYGRVYCDGCDLPRQITFDVTKKTGTDSITQKKITTITTDENRDYSMFLPPGIYKIKVINAQKRQWGARIRSYSNPIRQDIYLHKIR